MVGNTVSHSNRRVKRRFLPNLKWYRFWVPNQDKFVRLRLSTKGLRIVEKFGIEQVLADLAQQKNN
jgi:large subunit ribosomal protein L28